MKAKVQEKVQDPQRELLQQVIEIIRRTHFIPEYQEQATDAECLGIALAHYFGWAGMDILETCYAGLEDSNFHTINEVIDLLLHAEVPNALAEKIVAENQ